MSMVDGALKYIERGWPSFPLAPGAKHPITKNGVHDASTDPTKIQRWWDKEPKANVGVATGKASGFFVLDIDGPEGSKSLTALESEIGPLPETLEQMTGREDGGRQLFFKMPPTRDVGNRTNVRPGIDVRGTGGYIVVPPSIHPSGKPYSWPYGEGGEIRVPPAKLIDIVAPRKRRRAPWERPAEPERKPSSGNEVLDRARRYLRECESATEGAGGHDKLLWAARALVVGFELDDQAATSLLWSEFNPRCDPPWERSDPADVKDFERKVAEARRTPGEKARGWLLDEYGLRSDQDALAALGKQSASNLLQNLGVNTVRPEPATTDQREPFPIGRFPPQIADFLMALSESQCVEKSVVGLPAFAVVGAAIGNAWRLKLKRDFVVPPIVWVALIGASGTNKSGPLRVITQPLRRNIRADEIGEDMLCPIGRSMIKDATVEAIIQRLAENPRGLLSFRDELAGWTKSFNAYKKGGGADEQVWIDFWQADEYRLDRKSDDEAVCIPAAAVCVLGGIQPKVLIECFDPGKFHSGLVPRLLITAPPDKGMYWTEAEVSEGLEKVWNDAITWIRTMPFESFDVNTQQFMPHILTMEPGAKSRYVEFFNQISGEMQGISEFPRMFSSKARIMAPRLSMHHRALWLATESRDPKADMLKPIPLESVEAGVAWADWCLREQLRVYGYGAAEYDEQQMMENIAILEKIGKPATVRQVQRFARRRFPTSDDVKEALDALVQADKAVWDGKWIKLL